MGTLNSYNFGIVEDTYKHGRRHNFESRGYKYYCERSEQRIFWVVPPTYAILGGTTAIKRGIRRAYRTALIQYLTGRARAILANRPI